MTPPDSASPRSGRALQADVAHPVVPARVRAAVDAEFQIVDLVAKAVFETQHDLAQLGLGLGDRVVAQRLAGAGDAGAANAVRVQREADLGYPADDLLQARFGNAGQDEVLLAGDADVAAVLGDQVGDLDGLLAGDLAEEDREADVVEAFLLLLVDAEVVDRAPSAAGPCSSGSSVRPSLLFDGGRTPSGP